ncbi:MAG: TlpA disulfide reductase family protein [Pirellulales bacterium]
MTALFAAICLALAPLRAADEKPAEKKSDKKAVAAPKDKNGQQKPAAKKEPKDKDTEAKDAEAKEDEKEEKKAEDRYAVPETKDADELVKFVTGLKRFRAQSREEFFEHVRKAPAAIKTAAECILELEKDKPTEASAKAKIWLLEARAESASEATPKEQKQLLADVIDHIKAKKDEAGVDELRLAVTAASAIEQGDNTELAIDAYEKFHNLFSKSKAKPVADYAASFEGVVRRLKLPGNEIEIKGKLSDGTDFDWSKYNGKVVLIDYWATWCGPCRDEVPNVKANYKKYHDRGFEVVGISLDEERDKVEEYMKNEEIPWVTLFEDGAGWKHSMAKYYGIQSIPTVILVDQKGKVVSLKARGTELGKLLEQLLAKK